MSDFRTIVSTQPSATKMRISDSVFTIGSCFSATLGAQLASHKMKVLTNPFGTIYSPAAILKALQYGLLNEGPPARNYIHRGERWFNYDFHSSLSAPTQKQLQSQLNEIIGVAHNFLLEANWIIITLGTAWLYKRHDTGEPVANCHKIPQNQFRKELITVPEITDQFEQALTALQAINPQARLILTVSPVRHLKDSLVLNSVSKAVLRVACHEIAEKFHNVEYFPSFEIMVDDLRDYRFYGPDMIHPSSVAEEYIWNCFTASYCDAGTLAFLSEWKQIRQAINHRPFHPDSAAHQSFLADTLKRLKSVQSVVNVDDEIDRIQSQIK